VRGTRAFVASFGASLSLVLAGSLALMAVSTVVAFQGWPGIAAPDSASHDEVLASVASTQTDRAQARAKAASLVVAKAAPKPRVVVHRAHKAPATHVTKVGAIPAPTTVSASGHAKPVVHPAAAPQSTASAVAPVTAAALTSARPTYTAGDPVRKVGNDLGGGVAGAGAGLGGVLDNISPALGNTVEKVTTAVGGAVAGVTQIVAAVLDSLTKPPAK
jgi:hypothetical protein